MVWRKANRVKILAYHVMRTYETTHPWLKFEVDLTTVPYHFWLLLGEARSKCDHIAGVPLFPEEAAQFNALYLAKGVHATTSIEGNTLSVEEVDRRIRGELQLPRSKEYLGREVDNIVGACRQIVDDLHRSPASPLTPDRIRQFNGQILDGLDVEDDVVRGEYRRHSVGVMDYRAAPAEDCPYLIDRLCDWLNGPAFQPDTPELSFGLAVVKAIIAHLYLAWIHPFGDGNGRTARLIEFQLLLQSGIVPFPSAHLLSNHYNLTRSRYYTELSRTSKSGGRVDPFLLYAIEGLVDGLREQVVLIRTLNWAMAWESYVHNVFREAKSSSDTRRKHLILDLANMAATRSQIAEISPRVIREYATMSDKTLTRDLGLLVKMKLLRREGEEYVANRELIETFLPGRVPEHLPFSDLNQRAGRRNPLKGQARQTKSHGEGD